jgi:hypothetical protein
VASRCLRRAVVDRSPALRGSASVGRASLLRTDFLSKAAQHPGFCGFQYVLAEQGRAVGILWYARPVDLDGITQLVGTWFQDHLAPRLAGPETAIRGRVVVNMTPPRTTRT